MWHLAGEVPRHCKTGHQRSCASRHQVSLLSFLVQCLSFHVGLFKTLHSHAALLWGPKRCLDVTSCAAQTSVRHAEQFVSRKYPGISMQCLEEGVGCRVSFTEAAHFDAANFHFQKLINHNPLVSALNLVAFQFHLNYVCISDNSKSDPSKKWFVW